SHRLLAAQLAAQKLDGAIGQDLVDVHIALGARTGLPDIERELVIKLARYRLVGRLDDRFGAPWLQPPGLLVDQRACLLNQTVGSVYLDGHAVVADREMLQRALRLRAPVLISGDVDVAEAVEFASRTGGVDRDRDVGIGRNLVIGLLGHRSPLVGGRVPAARLAP